MINFASLFNQFRGNSSIGDLIDSPGITIDRLLDEDSFVNEFKSNNAKVLQFMQYDKYRTLVRYVTQVGPVDDRKRSYKFPLSACDLLSIDSTQTLDFFFGDQPIFIKQEVVEEEPEKPAESTPVQEKQPSPEPVVVDEKLQVEEEAQPQDNKEEKAADDGSAVVEVITSDLGEQSRSETEIVSDQNLPKVKTVDKQVEPLRFALFSYFEGEVNYTLAGYVSKVFTTFFLRKPQDVCKFLLEPSRFKQLLNHIESRSVGQLITKLLTLEHLELLQQRRSSFEALLEKVSQNAEIHAISNLSTCICETIEKVAQSVKAASEASLELSRIYFTPAIITQIISNVMSDHENVSVYNAPILQTYLTNVPLVIPEKSQMIEDLKLLLLSFLKKTLEKLGIRRESRPAVGFGRVKIVEIISFVLRENILNARELAAQEDEFFPTLFALCQNYQYNNVLHNEVVKIVDVALNDSETSTFLQSLFKGSTLINLLVQENEQDQKIKSGSGSQKARKGYIGHIVAICRKIQENATKNQLAQNFAQKQQFQKVVEELVNKEVYDYNKTLAGYSMKRGSKQTILFVKEEVIQEHIKFLAATPPPVYETEVEPINIEHPDLIEAEKVQELSAHQISPEAQKIKQEEESFDSKFFDTHLKFELDELMSDL